MWIRFFREERGASSIEYSMIAALVAVIIVGALVATSNNLAASYDNTVSELADAIDDASS